MSPKFVVLFSALAAIILYGGGQIIIIGGVIFGAIVLALNVSIHMARPISRSGQVKKLFSQDSKTGSQLTNLRKDLLEDRIDLMSFLLRVEELFKNRIEEITDWSKVDPWTDALEPLSFSRSKIDTLPQDLKRTSQEDHQQKIPSIFSVPNYIYDEVREFEKMYDEIQEIEKLRPYVYYDEYNHKFIP